MSLIFATLLHPINDITTSFNPVPLFTFAQSLPANKGKTLEYAERMQPIQQKLYPDLQPLMTKLDSPSLFALTRTLAGEMKNWEVTGVDAEHYRLEAVATSALLRFADDVVIEVRAEPSGASLHMRSRSRLGRNDFAANYKRIFMFQEELRKRLN